ncbi:MAG: hypothetical protein ABSF00_06410 [Candidatus Bathyarchaeia archaeon]
MTILGKLEAKGVISILLGVLCFSKDRPLQLEGYLTSIARTCKEPLALTVLYACGNEGFERAYETLKSRFPEVSFVRETDFRKQVLKYFESLESDLFMFGSDDAVFKSEWKASDAATAFQDHDKLLAFSLRLGTELSFCQPQNSPMPRPRFLETNPFLVWKWKQAQLDWGYPWEENCTIYEAEFAREIVRKIDGWRSMRALWKRKFKWAQPNLLEGVGADLVRYTLFAELPELMASYPHAKANVVTVNRVQSVSPTPVYGAGVSSEDLLQRWTSGTILDVERYANTIYDRIHIGDLFLASRQNRPTGLNP